MIKFQAKYTILKKTNSVGVRAQTNAVFVEGDTKIQRKDINNGICAVTQCNIDKKRILQLFLLF